MNYIKNGKSNMTDLELAQLEWKAVRNYMNSGQAKEYITKKYGAEIAREACK